MSIYEEVVKTPKRYENDYGCYTWYEADFKNLNQLELFLKENPRVNTIFEGEQASLVPADEFHGESLNNAIEYLTNGEYKKNYEQFLILKNEIRKALEISTPRRKTVKSYVGKRVHMPNYVANKPKSMLRLESAEKKRFITINFNLSYNGETTQRQIHARGILTLNLIKLLEQNNYVVKLNAFELSKCEDEFVNIKLNLKRQNQVLDERSCFFPFCAKEFLRRDCFRILESMPVENYKWHRGYGSSVEGTELKEILNLPNSDIIITSPDSMGIYGHDFYADADRFFENINLSKDIKVKKLKR